MKKLRKKRKESLKTLLIKIVVLESWCTPMCNKLATTSLLNGSQLHLAHCSCIEGFGFRYFFSTEEKLKALQRYKDWLQNEIITLEKAVKKLEPMKEVEV